MESVLVIIDRAPYGWEDAFSGFFVEIACLNKQLDSDVILIEDGVYAALNNQNSENIKFPSVGELTYLVFPEGNIFVHEDSLKQRGLKENQLIETADIISDEDIYNVIKSKEVVIRI